MSFTGENVIITGGGTGIGLSLARKLSENGNTVTICGRRLEALETAKHETSALNIVQCDITQPEQQDTLFEAAEAHGPVTMLINNAGMTTVTNGFPEKGASDEEIHTLFAINCIAPLQLTRRMIERGQKGGRIVQIGSLAGMAPLEAQAIYAGTKAAIKHASWSLRGPAKRHGFNVIHVQTPSTATPMTDDMHVAKMSPDVLAGRILKAAKQNRPEVRPHLDNYTSELGWRFAPWVLKWIATNRYKKLT